MLQQEERRGPGRAPPAATADEEDEDGEFDDEDLLASTAGVEEAAAAAQHPENSDDSRQATARHLHSRASMITNSAAFLKPATSSRLSDLTVRSAICVFSADDWAAVQVGRISAPNSFWQHLNGHVSSSQWPMLHDGAGCHSGTAKALPLKADI